MILMKIFRFSCTFLVEAHAAQLVQAGGQQEWLDQGLAAAPIKVVMMNIVVIMIMLVKVGKGDDDYKSNGLHHCRHPARFLERS